MKISFQRDGYEYVITNEHTGASYGQPVLLADGKLTDTPVKHEPDEINNAEPTPSDHAKV